MNPAAPVILTMGDPAGIGPELIVSMYRDHPDTMAGTLVYGDVSVMRRAAGLFAGDLAVVEWPAPDDTRPVPAGVMPVVQATGTLQPAPDPGRVSAIAGRMAADCVTLAARATLDGRARAIVTAPLNKESLSAAGMPWPGHTEMLQSLAAQHAGVPVEAMPVRMMLANDEIRTVLVSVHLGLRKAIEAMTQPAIVQTLMLAHESLRVMLGRIPRIAVAGLNPHAGEGGLFGREEIDIIAPAIRQCSDRGIHASGPWPPDTVFMRARQGEFDAVVAMYHDQALIPVKYLGVEHGVNVTLGLPLVRTSPDHGTAFDIAWQGRASPASMLAALRQARTLAASRPAVRA